MTTASLIVPTHRGAERLPVLLEALLHQTTSDWEAIVVIDGEVDDSAAIVARYADRIPVRAIALPTNRGRVTALNTGFAAATGDVLIRCDDDFEPGPHHIAAHVAAHSEGPRGAVGLPLNIAPDNAYMRAYGRDADERGRAEAYAVPAEQRWRIWGGNTSVSRAVYDAVGGFDDRYRGYGWEDLDYGYRIHRAGYPIDIVPEAEVRHHMASVTTAIRAERAFRSGHARRTFERLHGVGSSGPSATATEPAEPAPQSLWNHLVERTASQLTLPRTRRASGLVDRLLPMLPATVGRKCVALVVEASAQAGFRTEADDVV